MGRYYFNVTDGSDFYQDAEGALYDNLDRAREYALDVVRDLMDDGEFYDDFWVEIRNETGEQVARVDVRTRH